LPRRSNTDFQSVSSDKHLCLSIQYAGKPVPPTRRVSELQNHALDMRVNVERRRAQKTYERLVAVAREIDRKT